MVTLKVVIGPEGEMLVGEGEAVAIGDGGKDFLGFQGNLGPNAVSGEDGEFVVGHSFTKK
jgi:hypothetical protein